MSTIDNRPTKPILARTRSTVRQQGWKKQSELVGEELVADRLWCEPGPQLVRLLDIAMRPENEPVYVVSDDDPVEEEEEEEDCSGGILANQHSSSSDEEEQQAAAQDPYAYDEMLYETIEREKKEEDFDKVPPPVSRKRQLCPDLSDDKLDECIRHVAKALRAGDKLFEQLRVLRKSYATTPVRSTNTYCADFVQTSADDFVWLSNSSCNEVLDALQHRLARCDESSE